MGVHRGCADGRTAGLVDHHRLAGVLCQAQCFTQSIAAATAFDIGRNHACLRVSCQPCDAVGGVHIGFVAGGHILAEADAALRGQTAEISAKRAALRGHGHRPRDQCHRIEHRREGQEHAGAHVHQPDAIRTQQANARRPALVSYAVLGRRAFSVDLGKSRGEDGQRLDAARDALIDGFGHHRGRQRDHGQVDVVAHIQDRGIRRQPLHLGMSRIDREYATGITAAAHERDGPPANAIRVVGCPDDCHTGGSKEVIQSGTQRRFARHHHRSVHGRDPFARWQPMCGEA